jgi:hypothetical protein|tara:strand:- start:4668 stop:5015 length:348 start_codon:yes stop_codon:yes gene_type:complete
MLKYTKVRSYDIEDGYAISLEEMPPGLADTIANFIENNIPDVEINDLTTYIYGGHVSYYSEDYFFAFELMKASGEYPTLTDLSLITIDEYLDLINLNLYIKTNEKHKQRKKKRGK